MDGHRRWQQRIAAVTVALVAGSVLVLGDPDAGHPQPPGVSAATRSAPLLELAAAHPRRWPGHPDRRIVLHRVRRGETATGLAVRFHAWTAELVRLNHLGASGRLRVGQWLRIPVVVSAARRDRAHHRRVHHRTHHHRTHHRSTHPAPHHRRAHHARPHHRTHPSHRTARPWRHADASRAQVRRVVARTARRHGVDPLTALAISWQESGWQQRRISSAGAIGAMQVMPGTGRWISSVTDRRLNLYGLGDNATAGVVLFRLLRHEAGWRRSIAAYYQGLGSVRQRGPYPSTRRYTRNVTALHRRLRHGWDPS